LITDEQLNEWLTLQHEIPAVECKGPGSLKDSPLQGRVIRAAIGMANRRDGGIVIVGVAQRDHVLCPDGLNDDQMATWRYEDISDAFTSYADPPISFDFHPCQWQGKNFVILRIHEFGDVPIICKKEYKDDSNESIPPKVQKAVLRPGMLYARSTNKPETTEVTAAEGARTILNLAIEKGIQKFIEQALAAGLSLAKETQPQANELFDQQRESWTSPLIQNVQSRGYWMVIIRPEQFKQERIGLAQLYPLIQNTAVNLRSHSFPYIEPRRYPPGEDWVGSDYRISWIIETWRLYQSGQFIYFGGMLTDWRDQSPSMAREGWKPGDELAIEEAIYRCTEFFAFASRLALTDAYHADNHVHIEILVSGLQGRALSVDPYKRLPLFRDFVTSANRVLYAETLKKEELIAHSRELAFQPARRIFERFNWHPSMEYLQAIQSEIGQLQ
jgi:hypothetical protein